MSKTPTVDRIMATGTFQQLVDYARQLEAAGPRQTTNPEPADNPWRRCAEAFHEAASAKKMKDVNIAIQNGEALYQAALETEKGKA